MFRDHGYPDLADEEPASVEAFVGHFADARLLVAASPQDAPAGFAAARPIGGWLWLCELSVDPAHGRQGLGGALVDAVGSHAAGIGLAGIGLSTFRDLPFNAPFYRRLGFRIVDLRDAPDALRERFMAEVPPGVDPAARCLMTRPS